MTTSWSWQQEGAQLLPGPTGIIEAFFDQPARPACGLALVAHPQPLLGGDARHKVPQFLSHALREAGWLAVRPNFRGVGRSEGTHDAGMGETDDLWAVLQLLQAEIPALPVVLVGFSFGAFVQARLARRLADAGRPAWRTFLAGMPFGTVEAGRVYDTPDGLPDALVVHGEQDLQVPLDAVLAWARPGGHPVVVVPGVGHFFTGRLPMLRSLLMRHVQGASDWVGLP